MNNTATLITLDLITRTLGSLSEHLTPAEVLAVTDAEAGGGTPFVNDLLAAVTTIVGAEPADREILMELAVNTLALDLAMRA